MSEHDERPGETTVRRVAALARLAISDEEARTFGAQFARILEHFRVLAELDVEGVEPMAGAAGLVDVLRDDEPVASFPAEALLAAAPRRADGFYAVPKTVGPGPAR
jgi:aspartyl-tRNA(Asn)/glutamyl-tRNA(Gln) amidotransferase subunit C